MLTTLLSRRNQHRAQYRWCNFVCVALLVSTQGGSAQEPRTRRIPYTGANIRQQLLPDDQIVQIVREQGAIQFDPAPTAPQLIDWVVSRSDVVAVGEIRESAGVLVEDGTWIRTRVVAVVEEVFKDINRPLRRGGRLEFNFNGGEVMIGKVLVKAWQAPQLHEGRRYFIFAAVNPDTGVMFNTHAPLLIEGDTLISSQDTSDPDPMDGFPLQRLTAEVKRLSGQP